MMNIPASFTIATAEESQKIDAETVQSFGIDEFSLMEVAGISAAKEILKKATEENHGVFLCGKGNNGGDALVVARYLAQRGIKCTLVFVGGSDDLSASANKNLNLLQKINEHDSGAVIDFYHSWGDMDKNLNPDFIIDGMLGTGLNSELRGDYTAAVSWANDSAADIYAMDIPTGLHADTGKVMGKAIRATNTFAFGVLKQGFYLESGFEHTGVIHFCELPFPAYIKNNCSSFLIHESWVPKQSQSNARHKYEAGLIYVIAGSEGLTGAAMMAAKSAWSAGAGAVILICPRGLLPAYDTLPQIIKKPVGSKEDFFFKKNHVDEVRQITNEKPGTTLIGPGMGRDESTEAFIMQFLKNHPGDCIIDADALWALAHAENWEKPESTAWILTPHPGELKKLLNEEIENDYQRLHKVKNLAIKKKLWVLSKGFPVILGSPDGMTYIDSFDSRIFSRAGFGDVLAGKISAFRAMGNSPQGSCSTALLSGQNKVAQLLQNDAHYKPEPFDLL